MQRLTSLNPYRVLGAITALLKVKRYAVSVLGSLRTTEAVPALIAALEDGDANLVTLRALFHIGDVQAIAALRNRIECAEGSPAEIELCRSWQ